MKRKGFTLIELLAVLVVLAIILAIAVPAISGIITTSTKSAFASDAKMVLKAIGYKKMNDSSFDETIINENNIYDVLGLSNENYDIVRVTLLDDITVTTIQGKGKWNGLVACGSYNKMKVVSSTSDCNTDFVPPVITMLGDNPVNVFIGDVYIDAGATALDNIDGDLTYKLVVTGTVNSLVPGTYSITYSVMDNGGNETVVTRTINIIDNVKPTIDFTPNGNSTYAKNREVIINVTDVGIIDNSSLKYVWTTSEVEPTLDDFKISFTNNQTINTPSDVSGSYYLWVVARDTAGNETISRSDVFSLDNTKPIITLNGDANVTVNKGSTYTDAGATVSDTHSGLNGSVTVTGSVNVNVIGTYTITYTVSDKAGNEAFPVTRTINVVDFSAPVITILGENPVTIYVNQTYSDAGATALDDVDGDVTSKIIKTGTVNPSVVGTYTITYTVSDKAGNEAVATRTVNVIDDIAPTVVFGTNGNSMYAKSYSTTVTVSDTHSGVNPSGLKYIWNKSTAAPSEGSFSTTFTNGGTISSQAGVSGGYYLWILAKDNAGNTTIVRTNVFNLDNTQPTIAFNPASSSATNSNVSVVVTPTDVDSGISKWRYRLSSDNGSTYGAWQGVPTGFDPSQIYTLAEGANVPTRVGTYMNLSINHYYMVEFDYVCTSDSVMFNVDLHPDTLPEIWPTATTTLQHYVWNNIISSSTDMNNSRLRFFNNIVKPNPTNIHISNVNLYPKGVHTILLDTDGNWKIQIETTDNAGNVSTSTSGTYVIDKTNPTVVFGTNGNSTYAKNYSTTVTVSDNMSLNTSSLKYQWTTSTTTPSEGSFSTTFTSGGTISSPVGVSGSYYLWILSKDNAGNTTITRTNVFNLDNTKPIITLVGNSTVEVIKGNSYTDAGATASDAHSGINGSVTATGTVNTNVAGTYTITYNVSDKAGNAATSVTRTITVLQNVYNFDYTGDYKMWTVPTTGTIKIELWGGQGGGGLGGKGGYSVGNYNVISGQILYIYVGGCGCNGGWNGGGVNIDTSANNYTGGGASDVRVGGISLENRIIVSGGGGASDRTPSYGGAGGGFVGENGQNLNSSYLTYGTGGTQTTGGVGGNGWQADGTNGFFGQGGKSAYTAGSGGGGYYGGGGGSGWYADDGGGGGGSSYIGGVISGQTISGNVSMPNPSGGAMVGKSGNGYARITVLN